MSLYKQVNRHVKLSAQVAGQIEDLYRQGKLEAGSRLPAERELCDTFGVSRTVVREAVNILSAKGLLETRSGSGTYVRVIGVDTVEDTLSLYFSTSAVKENIAHAFEFRVVLEVQIAKIAAQRRSMQNLKNLENIMHQMEMSLENPEMYFSLDVEFHMEIARSTGNPMFELFLKPNSAMLEKMISYSNDLPGRPKWSLEAHKKIAAALREQNDQRAGESMYQHLDQYRTMSLSIAKGERQGPADRSCT